jgi:hypothetical protein
VVDPSAEPRAAKKSRSPRYPGIPLDVAIQRAHALYEHEHKNWAPIASIQEHWGFTPDTGPSNGAVAALRQFGLIETDGLGQRRRARLTPLAMEIILAAGEPRKFIRQAALIPELHKELWARYEGHLPSDATLRHHLIIEKNFTQHGAQEFMSQFRKTIVFARLDEDDSDDLAVSAASPVAGPPAEVAQRPAAPTTPAPPDALGGGRSGKVYIIPLLGSAEVQISGDFPLTEAAWRQLLQILEVYKPSLVVDRESE